MARLFLLSLALFVVAASASHIPWPKPRLNGRIVGGEDTTIEEYPYQLSLLSFGYHICGASVLSEEWVLTAAHCVYMGDAKEYVIRAGSSIQGKGGSLHIVSEIIWHPKYDSWTTDFDFALIRLRDKLDVSKPEVNPITLTDSEPQGGEVAVVTGWGALSSGGGSPDQLQKVEVHIVDRTQCEKQYEDYGLTERMICAGESEGGKDSCQGDSGGPLAVNGKQVGVVSWGLGCADADYPGVYSNIANQRDWIKEVSGI